MTVWEEISRIYKQVTLVLLGSGGADIHNCESELRQFVKKKGLESNVLFTGNVRNVDEYLQASDIFVFPSKNDAFPLALIEAMACGLPVIATPVGAIKQIVSHKLNGFVVDTDNYKQLYSALMILITDSSFAATLGKAARQTVQEKYAEETVVQKYRDLFEYISRHNERRPKK